jgi:hypothetical protein
VGRGLVRVSETSTYGSPVREHMNQSGWRYWTLDRRYVLTSPQFGNMAWTGPSVSASCPSPQQHDSRCECGIYATTTVLDLLYDLKLKLWLTKIARRFFIEQIPDPWAVIGNVVVHEAKLFKSPMCTMSGCGCKPPLYRPEWVGRSARIESLWLPSGLFTEHANRVVAELERRYKVPVMVGWPPYSRDEWDNRIQYAGHRAAGNLQQMADAIGQYTLPHYREVGLKPPHVPWSQRG